MFVAAFRNLAQNILCTAQFFGRWPQLFQASKTFVVEIHSRLKQTTLCEVKQVLDGACRSKDKKEIS